MSEYITIVTVWASCLMTGTGILRKTTKALSLLLRSGFIGPLENVLPNWFELFWSYIPTSVWIKWLGGDIPEYEDVYFWTVLLVTFNTVSWREKVCDATLSGGVMSNIAWCVIQYQEAKPDNMTTKNHLTISLSTGLMFYSSLETQMSHQTRTQ